MSAEYVARRFAVFLLVVWAAASLNFLIPRLSPYNPIRQKLIQTTAQGQMRQGDIDAITRFYEVRFGLDQPLWKQYLRYLGDTARFNFGYSLSDFPTKALDKILTALPWSLGLVGGATVLAFALGTLIGALLAWPNTSKIFQFATPPLLALSAIPYYLLGLFLIFLLAYIIRLFPLGGSYGLDSLPELNFAYLLQAIRHSMLPALSIVLSALGFWALGMRGMLISVLREDYLNLAEAKGLRTPRIFLRYALQNALLPQTTSLALSLGQVVSGAILVEVVFSYPGVGSVLFQAIRTFDYFVIYGVVFMVILSIGVATLIIDFSYPLLDPRISYRKT